MENVIFLDFDGVINTSSNKYSVDKKCLSVLKKILTPTVKIVVISSHLSNGTSFYQKKIIDFLNKFGIYNIDFIDPNYEGTLDEIKIPSRICGIIEYLKNHPLIYYVILDDDYQNQYRLFQLNHYKTDSNKGLQEKDYSKIQWKQNTHTAIFRTKIVHKKEKEIKQLVKTLKYVCDKKS